MADAQPRLARLGQIQRQMNEIVSPQQAPELQNTLEGYVAEELVMLRQAISIQGRPVPHAPFG